PRVRVRAGGPTTALVVYTPYGLGRSIEVIDAAKLPSTIARRKVARALQRRVSLRAITTSLATRPGQKRMARKGIMSSRQRDVIRAHLGMLLWAVIVGLSFPLVGMITEGLPPLLRTALRFLLAAAVIRPMLLPRREPLPRLRALFFYSRLGLCRACCFGAVFGAAARRSALPMAVLYNSVPL